MLQISMISKVSILFQEFHCSNHIRTIMFYTTDRKNITVCGTGVSEPILSSLELKTDEEQVIIQLYSLLTHGQTLKIL